MMCPSSDGIISSPLRITTGKSTLRPVSEYDGSGKPSTHDMEIILDVCYVVCINI